VSMADDDWCWPVMVLGDMAVLAVPMGWGGG
jgi:hypothetical protein